MSRKPIAAFIFKTLAGISLGIFLLFGAIASGQTAEQQQSREALQKQLEELEGQISQYESTVTTYKKQGKSLQSEVDRLDSNVKKLNLQIKAVELQLGNLDEEISENKTKVATTESNLAFNKDALGQSLKQIYRQEGENLFALVLKNPQLSNFFFDLQGLAVLQDKLRGVVQKITVLKDELLDEQEELSIKRVEAANLKKEQASQRAAIQGTQKEKKQLLTVTKGQESKYQELLTLTKKTAAQIRSRIFEFLGGGELSFGEAYKFAKVAEQATGVRAALIMAVLDRESALGQNVGRCKYNQINPRTGRQTMHPTRDTPLFLALVSQLGIGSADSLMVSCANRDGAYGGAMGPAQFIPSTWNLYLKRITDITGNSPPSPWRNGDAFVATALYLKDAGVYRGAAISDERKAAARYYAGSRWQSYLWTYGERVVSRAQQFQQDIDVLND